MKLKALAVFILLLLACPPAQAQNTPPLNPEARPPDVVEVQEVIPDVLLDIRYYDLHNFLGVPVEGYLAPKCLLTRRAAQALAGVQAELKPFGLSLKIYDCYRPQRAVNHFVRWAQDLGDTRAKKEFYPTVDKANLFKDGYIAAKSGHSRGSTLDLTIVPLPAPPQPAYRPAQAQVECFKPAKQRFADNSLDMGTGFDCFDPAAHTLSNKVSPQQRVNRALLMTLMDRHGFKSLPEEWWHYTLRDEPYPDTYFDFPVQ